MPRRSCRPNRHPRMRKGCCSSSSRILVRHQDSMDPQPQGPPTTNAGEKIMPFRRATIGAAPLVLGLSFAFAQQTIVIPDNLFTQAGFVVKYATTPEKSAILRSLPPDKLVTRRRDGK